MTLNGKAVTPLDKTPISLNAGGSMDSLTATGFAQISGVKDTDIKNFPVSNGNPSWGGVYTMNYGGIIYQLCFFTQYGIANASYMRYNSGSPATWTNWRKQVNQDDVQTLISTAVNTALKNSLIVATSSADATAKSKANLTSLVVW